MFEATPGNLQSQIGHAGLEFRPELPLIRMANDVSGSAQSRHAARMWSLLGEYDDGPSPYGRSSRAT